MNTEKRTTQFLREDSASLGPLCNRLRQIRDWNHTLSMGIPEEDRQILQHCHVIHADETSLTLVVDSPHWATRLRFLTPRLIANLKARAGLSKLAAIRHKIAPPASGQVKPGRQKTAKMALSPKNSALMSEMAAQVQHPGLKAILKKIAEGTEK